MSFVHLHLHTEFSLLDGACRIKKLVERVKDLGQEAVAITDHGCMYGVIGGGEAHHRLRGLRGPPGPHPLPEGPRVRR